MFEYDFVPVPARAGKGEEPPYRAEVRRRAAEGWRLVQVLVEQPAAMVGEFVLVLERPTGAA